MKNSVKLKQQLEDALEFQREHMEKLSDYQIDMEYLLGQLKLCKSKNPEKMCDECDCWKHTREMCS